MGGEEGGRAAAWGDDPLGFMLAPTARSDFFGRHYEQGPLLSAGSDPGRFAGLLTLAQVDAFIDGADLRHGMLDLVNLRRPVQPASFIAPDGRLIPSAIAEEYLNGATIVLPHLHASLPQLGEFCRALEAEFSAHVQTNVYLTPPGQQGFAPHYDDHDVFILQLSGRKAWRLYGMPARTPGRRDGFLPGRHEAGDLSGSFTLGPGDCLYVPRGLMHDAESVGDAPSLHVTVGLFTRNWADLMIEAVAQIARAEPALRASLPPGYASPGFDRSSASGQFERLRDLIATGAEMDPAWDQLAEAFVRERRPQLGGVIATPLDLAGGAQRYRRRPLLMCRIRQDRGAPVLIGPGGDTAFDDGDRAALELALSGQSFALADLACRDPARLIRKLWANGFVEPVF